MIVPGLGQYPADFVVRCQLSALLGIVNRGILHLGMVVVWSTKGLWADFPFQRTPEGILGIQVFCFSGEVAGMTLAPVWSLMDVGRSVAEATRGRGGRGGGGSQNAEGCRQWLWSKGCGWVPRTEGIRLSLS